MNAYPAFWHHVGIVQPDEQEALAQMSLFGLGGVPRIRAAMVGAVHIYQSRAWISD